MGRGNFCLGRYWYGNRDAGSQWYVGNEHWELEEPVYFDYGGWEYDLQEVACRIMKKYPSFHYDDEYRDRYCSDKMYVLSNRQFRFGWVDNEWSMAFFVEVRDDLEMPEAELAFHNLLYYVEDGIEEILLDVFRDIYRGYGGWTAGKHLTKKEVA